MVEHDNVGKEIVSSSASLVEFRTGYIANASAASIAFLWSNWDILYRMSNGLVRAERLTERSWRGSGLGGTGEWHLMNSSIGVDEGRFEFYSTVKFLGQIVRGTLIAEYKRVGPNQISYLGHVSGELPRQLRGLRWLTDFFGNRAENKLNSLGYRSAELITQNPSLVRTHGDEARYRTFLEMLEEENALLRDERVDVKYFNYNTRRDGKSYWGSIGTLHQDLEKLSQSLNSIGVEVDFGDYIAALEVFNVQPRTALIAVCQLLEPIVTTVYYIEFGEPVRGLSLLNRINRLQQERGDRVKPATTLFMLTVFELGSAGNHPTRDQPVSQADLNRFKLIFSAMLEIGRWFYESKYARQMTEFLERSQLEFRTNNNLWPDEYARATSAWDKLHKQVLTTNLFPSDSTKPEDKRHDAKDHISYTIDNAEQERKVKLLESHLAQGAIHVALDFPTSIRSLRSLKENTERLALPLLECALEKKPLTTVGAYDKDDSDRYPELICQWNAGRVLLALQRLRTSEAPGFSIFEVSIQSKGLYKPISVQFIAWYEAGDSTSGDPGVVVKNAAETLKQRPTDRMANRKTPGTAYEACFWLRTEAQRWSIEGKREGNGQHALHLEFQFDVVYRL